MEAELVRLERTKDSRGRNLYSAEQKKRLLAEYDASGLTQAQFAKQSGMKYYTLVSWLEDRRESERGAMKVRFERLEMPAGVSKEGAGQMDVVVTLPDGTRIEGKNAADVVEVLEALRG